MEQILVETKTENENELYSRMEKDFNDCLKELKGKETIFNSLISKRLSKMEEQLQKDTQTALARYVIFNDFINNIEENEISTGIKPSVFTERNISNDYIFFDKKKKYFYVTAREDTIYIFSKTHFFYSLKKKIFKRLKYKKFPILNVKSKKIKTLKIFDDYEIVTNYHILLFIFIQNFDTMLTNIFNNYIKKVDEIDYKIERIQKDIEKNDFFDDDIRSLNELKNCYHSYIAGVKKWK